MITATPTQADRLAAAAAITAKARHEIEQHEALALTVNRLKAFAGELDDQGAADLVRKSEALRISEITLPRRKRALDDAQSAEVAFGLEVLAALSDALAPVEKDAATAADLLTAALVDPAAAALEDDIVLARHLGVARCWVEKAMPGVYGASVLRERIRTASQTTWGAGHVPTEAAAIVSTFDAETAAIRSGTAMLRATLKTALKT